MLEKIFVTGTDTAVGKTVVSRALLQALIASGKSAVGFKPVGKGSQQTVAGLRNKDALVLQQSSSVPLDYLAVNPVALPDDEISISNVLTDYRALSQGLCSLTVLADSVVVEGTGGWRSLISDQRPLSDWVVQEQLPVVLVVGIKPGCISHALLTAQAILHDGLPLIGWVANRINPGVAHYAEIITLLADKIPAPMLGELPYLPRAETRELARYIDLTPLAR